MLLKYQERYKAIVHQQLRINCCRYLEAQFALSSVKARHEKLLNTERSVQEIRDIFVQMAILVDTQGDNIKRIEFHLLKAGGCTDHGKSWLQKAQKIKVKQRKKKLIFLGVFIIVIGCVIIFFII
ncbi:syntaxin-1A homolog [Zootermopsis nevadensis]|uniref:syntaxin-1A homolog n=1 Tax=Zootermopsis nevadensis TaxID=136037 RepID=UPI000B8ECE26|nr:syntaxin-1A homolog [Zootermopsis nevadensis]